MEKLQFVISNLTASQLWGCALFALLGFAYAFWRWHRPLAHLEAERDALLKRVPEECRPINFGLGNAPLPLPDEPGLTTSDHSELEDLIAQRDARIAALETTLTERTKEVAASRAESDSLRSSVAVVTALASTKSKKRNGRSPAAFPLDEVTFVDDPDEKPPTGTFDYAPLLAKYPGETVSIDSGLGIIFPDPPTGHDDLTEIKGIGAILQEKLNTFGIYRYQQIADWTDYNIWMANRRLAFTGRIQRENWVDQAKSLTTSEHQIAS